MPLFSRNHCWAAVALAVLLLAPTTCLSAQDDDLLKAAAAKATERLGDVQKKLATGSEVQKRFRIDGFSAAGNRLKITGTFLEPGFVPPKDAGQAKEDDPNRPRPPFEVLQDDLGKLVKEEIKGVVKDKGILFDFSGIARIEGKDQPHVLLQKVSNDDGATKKVADECRFDGSRYDATGTLLLLGTRGEGAATRDWLESAKEKVLGKNPAAVQGAKLKVSTAEMKPTEWKLAPGEVQKLFAASGNEGLLRLRVDRVYLAHNPDNPDPIKKWSTLRLTLSGVRMNEVPVDPDAILTMCRKHWPEFFKGAEILGNPTPLVGPGVAEPVDRLRKIVAERPALDGVRIDAGATFGPRGELLLAGIRPRVANPKQSEAIEKGVSDCYKEVLADLIAVGDAQADRYKKLDNGLFVSIADMREADTWKVLGELRKWAETYKDDVQFTRLYFGADGGLKLLCKTPPGQDVKEIEGKLREFAPEYFPGAQKPGKDAPKKAQEPLKQAPVKNEEADRPSAQLPISSATIRIATYQNQKGNEEPTSKQASPPVVEPSSIPAFTPFLRKQVADDPKKRWTAVLIERGYFDENNRYTIRGVVEHEDQKKELSDLIESFAGDPKWAAYFIPKRPKGQAMVLHLDVIPMAAMVARVQRVTPAYPVFDGVRVVSASYDKDANLVFSAHVVGKPNLKECRSLLADLVSQHPDYSRRLVKTTDPKEPRLKIEALPPSPVDSNDQLAEFSIGYAAQALAGGDLPRAKKWLDLGLLHYPDDSSIWYLSAYYNLLQGDKELVRRDLFRVIEIEGRLGFDGPIQRKRRYLAAKDLQGEDRSKLEKLWLENWKEAKDSPKQMTLVVPK